MKAAEETTRAFKAGFLWQQTRSKYLRTLLRTRAFGERTLAALVQLVHLFPRVLFSSSSHSPPLTQRLHVEYAKPFIEV
ncbi:hypothetical protein TSMEX_008783, partial [Taenia solium]|eukprot:TsM_000630400 transcript=TsM_000630400 gene=TsM_000630400